MHINDKSIHKSVCSNRCWGEDLWLKIYTKMYLVFKLFSV